MVDTVIVACSKERSITSGRSLSSGIKTIGTIETGDKLLGRKTVNPFFFFCSAEFVLRSPVSHSFYLCIDNKHSTFLALPFTGNPSPSTCPVVFLLISGSFSVGHFVMIQLADSWCVYVSLRGLATIVGLESKNVHVNRGLRVSDLFRI